MQAFKTIALSLLSIFILFGCAPAPYQKIGKPGTLLDRDRYSVLSPEGEDWHVVSTHDRGKTIFMKKLPSPKHTSYAMISREEMTTQFDTPEKFLTVMKALTEMMDPKRFTFLEQKTFLDDKFGLFSVRISHRVEDHGPRSVDVPYLIMTTLMYCFLDPDDARIRFVLTYSERGKAGELDGNFEESARKFFDGVKVKRRN